MQKTLVTLILTIAWLLSSACSRDRFPQWRAVPMGLPASWEQAPLIVVADLRNAKKVGTQEITKPPWPALPPKFPVYWCEGEFDIVSVIRGNTAAGVHKFLWGAAKPDCDIKVHGRGAVDSGPMATRVWFVRREGKYFRPLVDGYGAYFVAFKGKWSFGQDAEQEIARLLLTPAVSADSSREYVERWDFQFPSTACLILGRTKCVNEIEHLRELGDPLLKRYACDYLRSQLREPCTP